MRNLIILVTSVLVLVACGNETAIKNNDSNAEEQPNETKDIYIISEVVGEQTHNILLVDNDDFKITLLESKHERYGNAREKDKIEFNIQIENKLNRTFEFFIDKLKLDGTETIKDRTYFSDNEIGPNETEEFRLTTYTENHLDDIELSIKQHMAGTILYSDYERSRLSIDFSEYINE